MASKVVIDAAVRQISGINNFFFMVKYLLKLNCCVMKVIL